MIESQFIPSLCNAQNSMPDPFKAIEEPNSAKPSPRLSPFHALQWGVSQSLTWWVIGVALLLFSCSSARHLLFRSTAFDLGIYDQVVYLMSRGVPPISSFLGFHHMGNHAAFSVYPLVVLYWIYPSIYWLLAVQAVCLAIGAFPVWFLARQAKLPQSLAGAMVATYWLYPVVFNLNLFDFHPEVMALPSLLAAIWAARADRFRWFCVVLVFVLGCKAALSLTVAAMGVWLLLFEKRRSYGIVAIVIGLSWFVIATQWIIPTLSGAEAAAVSRYSYLGGSVVEIAQNLLLKPYIVLSRIFGLDSFKYLAILVLPLLWGLSPRHLAPLISVIPLLIMNLLSDSEEQRNLVHQYSLPILPFLLIAVMNTLATGGGRLRQRRWIIAWAIVAFVLVEYSSASFRYFTALDTWQATKQAIDQIPRHQGSVITDNYLGAHLSHRSHVYLARPRLVDQILPQTDYVLLNLRHPFSGSGDQVQKVLTRVQQSPDFQLTSQQDEVYLFTRRGESASVAQPAKNVKIVETSSLSVLN